jgi:hypothetical protein
MAPSTSARDDFAYRQDQQGEIKTEWREPDRNIRLVHVSSELSSPMSVPNADCGPWPCDGNAELVERDETTGKNGEGGDDCMLQYEDYAQGYAKPLRVAVQGVN